MDNLFEVDISGIKKLCRGAIYSNNKISSSNKYDCIFWVETGRDMWAINSDTLKDKNILVIRSEDWMKGKRINV